MTTRAPRKPFNGRHMTAILVAGFGVVVAVNFTMASLAGSTFSGVVVENSYVASQDFNRWLDEANREKALGWSIEASPRADGRVVARLGQPLPPAGPGTAGREQPALPTASVSAATGAPGSSPGRRSVTAVARHPLGRIADVTLAFHETTAGEWVSDEPLPAGRWTLRFEVEDGARKWRAEEPITAGPTS